MIERTISTGTKTALPLALACGLMLAPFGLSGPAQAAAGTPDSGAGAAIQAPTLPTPQVVYSFDDTQALTCEEVLVNVAIGQPVPLSAAPCLETALLGIDPAVIEARTGVSLPPADGGAALAEAEVWPNGAACESVLVGLALGHALPVTTAPCVSAYMLPHSPESLAFVTQQGQGG